MPRPAPSTPPAPARKTPRARAPAQLTRSVGEPLWRQLVQSLRADILRGVYRVGTQLPTEDELAGKFAVSRHTVREALRQLRVDGLVSSRQGSGTTVMPPPPATHFNVHRVASIDELIAYATESRYVVERSELIDGRDPALELPAPGPWLQLQGFRYHQDQDPAQGDQPICWTEVFVAREYAGVERLMNRQRGPIWQLIEDMFGERLVEVEQTLRVCPVPAHVHAGLQLEAGASVVEVRRVYRTSRGQVAEVSVNLYPAEKFRFTMKLQRA
ncbi:GntR family transcriptional regulator [Xylophilus rhododendri]|uniref:GntR family transcriptional regulator n=1 Tax=Xylophilus rhododendri TaxID=2697032 RepID=A0A857J1L1_9BURK|nr:GntR family transcriptional regulator [Xylophilus rhododendri]QHI97477.1 GntR family transcriptional regulator [Xylophilus rhododendri]